MGLYAEKSDPRLSLRRMIAQGIVCAAFSSGVLGQAPLKAVPQPEMRGLQDPAPALAPRSRAARFMAGRSAEIPVAPARAIGDARFEHLRLLDERLARPRVQSLSAPWQPLGPMRVASLSYGDVTGRVTSIAIDPGDSTGNTVYVGTSGGGVWKSTNAAGPASEVSFSPLTDKLPVFSEQAGSYAIPSLSVGAVTVQSGVVLAGTGDPNDAADSYYGGGILRSSDGGSTWTLISQSHDGSNGNHSFVGLGFAGFAWSTSTPGLVVAGVSQAAEGVIVNAPDHVNSVMGLYYSSDSGVTWQMASILDGSQVVQQPLPSGANQGGNAVTSVVWNPLRARFYAAVRFHGYYESADGMTWTRLTQQPGATLTLGACPTNPGLPGSSTCPIFRGALAVQATSGDLFALTTDSTNHDQGFYQDVCAPSGTACANNTVSFANRIASSSLEATDGSKVIPQADYDLELAAVPAGADTVLFAGTLDLFRCTLAGGCSLRNTTNDGNACAAPAHVAPSQHALAVMATGNQPLLFLGNDGGLWRSTDGVNQQAAPCSTDDATHFENLNSGLGSLAEVVDFAQDPTNPAILLAGLGANGSSAAATDPATVSWPQLAVGEGGSVAIDPADPSLWYVSTGAGVSLRTCTSGSSCASTDFSGPPTIGEAQVSDDVSLIDPPMLLDPAQTSSLLLGTCRVWRGPAGAGSLWPGSNALSTLLAGQQQPPCVSGNPLLRSLAAGGASAPNAGSQVLYAGMAGSLDGGGSAAGHVFTTKNAAIDNSSTAWTDAASSPVTNDAASSGKFNPGGFDISAIFVDPHDSTGNTVYVTVMGFAGNQVNAAHLYRSIDGGAHWTNVSSNLPNAPANSVIVDPNDANTVYVALDTGVYVTTGVTSCATANCWTVLGSGLPNAPVVKLEAAAGMPTGDGRNGELRASTYGRGIWEVPLLTAAPPAQPSLSLSPTGLVFAAQSVGSASAVQVVTILNTGTAPLIISRIVVSGDFQETDACLGTPIAVGSSCVANVSFLPTGTGSRTGVFTVYGNVAGGQATATLTGTGVAAGAVVLDPSTLTFPSITLGASSVPQNVTISNTGQLTQTISAIAVTGDFRISANTCGTTLAAGTGCTVAILFSPSASGPRTGTLTVTDQGGGQTSVQTSSLSGTGMSPATDSLSPVSLTFAAQEMGTSSTVQQITLTNAGDQPLTLISSQIVAPSGGSSSFTSVSFCGSSLNPHSSCSIDVTFNPSELGVLSGILNVTDAFRTQTISLSGIGIAPPGVSLSPVSGLGFPATPLGSSSAVQSVTLTNNGGLPLTIASTSVSGDFSLASQGSNCPSTLTPGSSCTLQLVFTPSAGGPRTGVLTIRDNASTSPQTEALSGAGIDFSLAPDGPVSMSVQSGRNAVYSLLLDGPAGVTGTAQLTCSGVPANTTCNINPSSVALGGSALITVTLDTGASATALNRLLPWRNMPVGLAFGFAPVFLWWLPGRRRPFLGWRSAGLYVLVAAVLVTCSGGCGAGRAIPASGGGTLPAGTTTPAGNYSITVSATSGGLTRSVGLTLVVQ